MMYVMVVTLRILLLRALRVGETLPHLCRAKGF